MFRYKIIVSYDGTDYFGWQVQEGKPSVAQALQDTFKMVFGAQIQIIGVSRTDAGVHASGQVATFVTESHIDPERMKYAWNNVLPKSMLIHDVQVVPLDHNPFLNISYKTYWYYFFIQQPSPFHARYGWHVQSRISLEKLKEALSLCVGTYNFAQFSTGDVRENTVRRIDSITVEFDQSMNAYKIVVVGPKFLRHMIRRVVGACIEIACRPELSTSYIKTLFETPDKKLRTLVSAPPHGLVLHTIVYDQKESE